MQCIYVYRKYQSGLYPLIVNIKIYWPAHDVYVRFILFTEMHVNLFICINVNLGRHSLSDINVKQKRKSEPTGTNSKNMVAV